MCGVMHVTGALLGTSILLEPTTLPSLTPFAIEVHVVHTLLAQDGLRVSMCPALLLMC